jgi:ATP-dependent helicase/nuclease subunit A
VLIDYKTDRWDGTIAGIEKLQAAYSTQLKLYCAGLESLLGRPVDEAWLYFLDAGQGFEVEPPRGEAEWIGLVAPAVLRQG